MGDFTDVASYVGSPSPNGTFDQAGNISEWNETIISAFRGARGGAFGSLPTQLASSQRGVSSPTGASSIIGFRVASLPEPGTGLLQLTVLLVLTALRRCDG